MKSTRKSTAPRNPFVAVAKFLKAGTHRKPYKALRRQEKMDTNGGVAQRPEQGTFNPEVASSSLATPTI